MKARALLSVVVLLSLVLTALPAPMAAQETASPPDRAQKAQQSAPAAPAPVAPDQGAWALGPTMCFDLTRIDAEFFPVTGKVYVLGGRSGANTVGNIYAFDPVAGTCVDTGAVMPTPISNYTINPVNDGTNDLLCTFGGRNSAGGVALDVQCYNPVANSAAVVTTLPPAWTGYTPGAQVVVDNMVYIFGGFNSTAAPYMTARTEKWDPVTNTFTQLGDMNLARSYILAGAVDGMIYAFGGDTFDGAALVAQTIAERMDPAAGTWDDAAVADLPIAGDEGRAFAFDSNSPYPYAGQIVLATMAQWSGASAEVVLYDVATNSYDTTFPDLLNARRNHADAFVPLCTGDPEDGLPGMWVLGGYLTGDNPPYAPTEYFPLPCAAECNILLVDDDWDQYSGEPYNGTGTYYYTSTLEALGYTYDRWDTWTQNDPGLADLQPYDVVVWFTGYAWAGTVTQTNEIDLAAYLDGGGNLILSAEDYLYDQGSTAFGQNYLGIGTFTEDVSDTDPVGNAGDPIGDGLGPYTLTVPTSWPVGGELYPDYAGPGAGAGSPFSFQASGENNSTDLDGGPWRTAFIAWPLEGLADLDDRVEVLGAALDWLCPSGAEAAVYLTPPVQEGTGTPGAVVTYELMLTNMLGQEETFDVVYDSIWPTSGPATVGPVPDGDEEIFQVQVTIPAGAQCNDSDLAVVTAWDSTDTYSDTAELLTTVSGELAGVVYDANTNLPIENARVWVVGVTDPNFYEERLTDAAGQYSFLPIPAGDYLITAAAYGYYTVLDLPITIATCTTIVEEFYLDASNPDLQPQSVSIDVVVDHIFTSNMALNNSGSGDLHFHITEMEGTALSPNKADMPMPSGVDPQVYADLKASADGTARFVVYLKDQADLDAAFGIKDWSARGQYVLDTLRATAQRSQAGLLAALDGAGAEYESRYIVNAVVVTGNAGLVDSIAARPEVGFIGPDAKIPEPKPVDSSAAADSPEVIEWNIKKILADSVWVDFGVTGQGVVLSHIDTGVQYDHPALVQQYRGNQGGGNFDHNYNWFDPYEQCPSNGTIPCDPGSHGTHVMGTMVGSDDPTDPTNATNAIGVAPGAKWIACKGGDAVSGYLLNAELIECAEWILAPWDLTGANPDPDMRPDAVNNSWGGGQAQWWYNQAIYAWRAAGIWPSFSNGNDGPNCGTAGDPGEMDNAISAGATTNTAGDTIATFSSRGPASVTGSIKPDVSAPGANVRSSVPTNGYANYSGTSMASPHVAATAGLIWSAAPELRGNVQVTEWIMEQTADVKLDSQCGPEGPPNNVYGWGRINAYNAVDYALGETWDVPWLTVDPVSGVVAPSVTQPIVLTFDATGLTVGQCYNAELKVEYNDPYIVEELIPVEMCVVESLRIYLPVIYKSYP
ncbi:MAG: S8 family serine peptidase [Anaerolineae bacterium]|nr:S8 family serine peptidase [Anaerolineae bacterium]